MNSSTSLQHLEAAWIPSIEFISPSRNPISRWSASTASWRRWRPHGSGGAGGDLGRGAAAIAMSLRSSDNGDDRSDELCYSY